MIQRCTKPNRPDYIFYGGRGIAVCDRWRLSYVAFVEDVGIKPDNTSLDRIDNARGYEPGNCRWASKHEQMQNTRATRLITHDGRTMGIAAWARSLGMLTGTISQRLRNGWPVDRALSSADFREKAR